MVAAVDIGNTTAEIRAFSQRGFETFVFKKETRSLSRSDFAGLPVFEAMMISSVVDEANPLFIDYCREQGIPCFFPDQFTPGSIDFSAYQSKMGPDRVCSALGAASEYPMPFCVVDMGTATTVSVVGSNGKYEGGLIFPGVGTLLKSLPAFTSRLPEVALREKPDALLGLNTEENIQRGVYLLAAQGLSGIVKRLQEGYSGLTVIGSGGWSLLFCEHFHFQDSSLIFKGLKYFFDSYFKNRGAK